MKKYIIIPMILLLNAIGARAQYTKSWTFNDWDIQTYTIDTENDDLTVHAASNADYNPVVSAQGTNGKTINVNGENIKFTKRLTLNGRGSGSAYVSFGVDGPCEITIVYYFSSNDGLNRILNVSYGDTYDAANLHSLPAVSGIYEVRSVKYELENATTINIGSGYNTLYIFGIYVKEITPPMALSHFQPLCHGI